MTATPPLSLPPHTPGMRIGLFGGTFNPPHEAHLAACLLAMKRLDLDRVWWLVTPANPLKDTRGLTPLEERIRAIHAFARHPRIHVTGFEAAIGSRHTFKTVSFLRRRCPRVHFVWIMGADNLRSFHRWQKWRDIAALVPIAVVDRGGLSLKTASGPAAISFAKARIPENQASRLPVLPAPAWVYLHGVKSDLSSTQIRAEKEGNGH